MLVDRSPPADRFALVPRLMAEFEPVRRALDRLLDADEVVRRLKADLARRAPHSLSRGRPGTPVEVVLRRLVVKRRDAWSDAEVARFVGDSPVLRQFCRVYLEKVPDATTLLRWANRIAPATLAARNERAVALARGLKVTRGRKLRLDSTVVATTRHHPSDSGLRGEGVRVLSRLLRRAQAVPGAAAGLGKRAFRTRTRSARRRVQSLHRRGRRTGAAAAPAPRRAYGRLIAVAEAPRRQAVRARAALGARTDAAAQRLARQVGRFPPRGARALARATRRTLRSGLKGEAAPAAAKIVGLFEPHTQSIVRHKAGKAVAFGRKLWLEEVDGGIVSGRRLLDAPGQDIPYLRPSLAAHRKRFGRPARLVTADRGVFSPPNEEHAARAGAQRGVIPAAGRSRTAERAQREGPRWCRRGLRFRAGIEGRISVLQRCYGLDRGRDHGDDGLGRWVGWGLVTANLAKAAATVAARIS